MPTFETAADALQAMVVGAEPSKLAGINKVVKFELTGEGGGEWTATIADGKIEMVEGATLSPNTTFKMNSDVFIGIVNGKVNPVAAFMQGKVRVEGDMAVAMRLQSLFM